MRQFKGIDWNLQKIEAHALSVADVEAAFNRVFSLRERKDGSYETFAETPGGRRIWVDAKLTGARFAHGAESRIALSSVQLAVIDWRETDGEEPDGG